ncbi:hypothetical protein PVAP13_3KG366854 [Panicum virgatum]|uniref:Uncharacterized protein n=1 Tax=Panicum virgatum TaxID=38727 RepID=A0A8T0UZL0_PANVG|nr:hypothetical protein PVAP13_3KG366854 [Panicum virgatum]
MPSCPLHSSRFPLHRPDETIAPDTAAQNPTPHLALLPFPIAIAIGISSQRLPPGKSRFPSLLPRSALRTAAWGLAWHGPACPPAPCAPSHSAGELCVQMRLHAVAWLASACWAGGFARSISAGELFGSEPRWRCW